MDGGAWKAAVHGVAEGQIRLSIFTFTFHFEALEKEMATYFNILVVQSLSGELKSYILVGRIPHLEEQLRIEAQL